MRNEKKHKPETFAHAPIDWVGIKWWMVENPNTCIYCFGALNETNRTRDHMISRYSLKKCRPPYGFRHEFGLMNTVPCCARCNQLKASCNVHEWPLLRKLPGYTVVIKLNAWQQLLYKAELTARALALI